MSSDTRIIVPSILSLGLPAFGPGGLSRSIEIALAAGFPGVHAAPLFGLTRSSVSQNADHIYSYQGPWGNSLVDKVVFSGYKLILPSKVESVTRVVDGANFSCEIHPAMSTTILDYVNWASKRVFFGADSYHLNYPDRSGRRFVNYLDLLRALASKRAINLIHVHPAADELDELLEGVGPTAHFLRHAAVLLPGVPAIIEIFPQFGGMNAQIELFKRIRGACEKYLM